MTKKAVRQPLTEHDWNFAAVPDNEVIACLLWEFFRESPTVSKLRQDCAAALTAGEGLSRHNPIFDKVNALRVVLDRPVRTDFFTASAFFAGATLADVPWQKLPLSSHDGDLATREKLLSLTAVNAPAFLGDCRYGAELAAKAGEMARQRLLVEDRTGFYQADIPMRARLRLELDRPDDEWEALLVVVDWGTYDNNAIRTGFADLAEQIIKSRPKGIKPKVRREAGRGNPNEWRSKLVNLGLARLYAAHKTVGCLKRENKEAWAYACQVRGVDKTKADTHQINQRLGQAWRRTVESFRAILPFEKGKLPASLPAEKPSLRHRSAR